MEVYERLERLRRRAELERRLLSRRPGQVHLGSALDVDFVHPGSAVDPGGAVDPEGPEGGADPEAAGTSGSRFWPETASGADPPTAIPPQPATVTTTPVPSVPPIPPVPVATGSAVAPEAPAAVELEGVRPPEDVSATDPERTGELALRTGKPVAPDPLAPVIYDVLAALQPVLRRYPGLTIAVWPAERSAEDLTTAVRFSVDPSTGLSLQMPVSPDGDPPTDARDAGSGDTSGGLADDVDRDHALAWFGVTDAEPSEFGEQGPGDSVAEHGVDQVVNRLDGEPEESQPTPESTSPRSVAAELACLLRQSEVGSTD